MTMTRTQMSARRRWSFRTRLTAIMAAAFAVSGAVLVLVQYLIFDAVFSSIAMTNINVRVDGVETVGLGNPGDDVDDSIRVAEAIPDVAVEAMASDVLAETMLWSLLLVAVFALFAWLLAWSVARRAMGRVHQVSATTREITERDLSRRLDLPGPEDEIKELGDTIDSMLTRLQSSFEAQSRFIANASHELRTPLTATRLTLEVPLGQGRVHETARPIIERAIKTTQRSERLVESLLTLARDPATLVGDAEAVDLGDLATTVSDEILTLARERGVAIRVNTAECVVDGNPELLRQLVENLVDNAVAHGREDSTVDVRVSHEGESVRLEVTSDGRTLDPDGIERLRQPFERQAPENEKPRLGGTGAARPGIGLGLSIVDSIASAHRGVLHLAARPGGGLVATVSLPITATDET